jgi:CRISPR/Cas system-associated exonuclease Cas4 (RecB family)
MSDQTLAERPHALYSPSRLAYLAHCPGWQGDGEVGDLAHRGTTIGERLAAFVVDGEDPLAGATPADQDAIRYGMAQLAALTRQYPGMVWQGEPRLDTGITDCWGYADVLGVDELTGEAVLIELKTGRGERAQATDNQQVRAYALGVFAEHPEVDEIHAYLIECDLEGVTYAYWTRGQIQALRSRIKVILLNAHAPSEVELSPGAYCAYCARREQCPPLADSPHQALAVIGARTLSPQDYATALSPQDLGETLTRVAPLAAIVDSYVGALKARAIQILEAGGEVPGWAVRTRGGARSWSDELAAMSALREAGADLSEITTLVSPAQVEKRLGKDTAALVAAYMRKGESRSLVPIRSEESP